MFLILLVAILGYLLGSIPFGLLVGRARGIDIRKHGSGNIGATNVYRTLGKKWGILVFVLDFAKGALAVLVGQWISSCIPLFHERYAGTSGPTPGDGSIDFAGGTIAWLSPTMAGILAALWAILGHNFPVWLKFKSGKGI